MRDFPSVASGLPVFFFPEIGSTNAEALTRAASGAPEQWIVSEIQTAGRGRRGRTWVSEAGNLYSSLLLYDPAPPAQSPQICFVAALAVHDAITDLAPALARERLRLKWPNDLLLDGKKIVGILVEGVATDGRQAVVTGIGVNCRHHPEATTYPTTDLAAAGLSLSSKDVFARLATCFMSRLAQWQRGVGFPAIRNAWLARAYGIGGEIEVRLQERALRGTFKAIDEDGALVLGLEDGHSELIRAGDIFPATSFR